jgi:hypothetical protein
MSIVLLALVTSAVLRLVSTDVTAVSVAVSSESVPVLEDSKGECLPIDQEREPRKEHPYADKKEAY